MAFFLLIENLAYHGLEKETSCGEQLFLDGA